MKIVEKNFTEVIELIRATRSRVLQSVNAELEYETKFIEKKILQAKLHELFEQSEE